MNAMFPVSSSAILAIRKGICASGKVVFGGGAAGFFCGAVLEPEACGGCAVVVDVEVGRVGRLRRDGSGGTTKLEVEVE